MPYNYVPELPLEPPEPEVDGVHVCAECKETIPGGETCYHVGDDYYCETCMSEFRTTAPYKGEWY